MSEKVIVASKPECDICKFENGKPGVTADYDGKTVRGPWANMCRSCFFSHGVGLGTGRGQQLLVVGSPEAAIFEEQDKSSEINAAIEAGDFDALEDLIGDGDIAEYL